MRSIRSGRSRTLTRELGAAATSWLGFCSCLGEGAHQGLRDRQGRLTITPRAVPRSAAFRFPAEGTPRFRRMSEEPEERDRMSEKIKAESRTEFGKGAAR